MMILQQLVRNGVLFVIFTCITAKAQHDRFGSGGQGHQGHRGSSPAPAAVLSLAQPLSGSSSSEEVSTNFSPEFFNPSSPTSHSSSVPLLRNGSRNGQLFHVPVQLQYTQSAYNPVTNNSFNHPNTCPLSSQYKPDFDALDVFPRLGFHDSWISQKWFWNAQDFDFEGRFRQKFEPVSLNGIPLPPPPLKVFVVPHSHNDPGWLKTFEGYFSSQTRHTLDLAVEKLTLYPNMTFVWNEICFLQLWWERAKRTQKIQFLDLIQEGRLEILTGAWVMADEATNTLYTLMDEIIEGRQWTSNFLGVTPNISWAIDPFGHGSVMPYLFKSAGIENMVIQRLHYAWKKYLGQKQYGNFKWVQRWDTNGDFGITCHNGPYDIYTTKHTCGPNPLVCLKLDFRSIMGEFSEYTRHARPVRDLDLDTLATELVGQFQRTASLYPSSRVVMFELGEDFRFDKSQEWDQQYENYVPLMNYINDNYHRFRVDIRFGTVTDYFNAIAAENPTLPTFSGDFFPYSDVYLSARPAYWTGFYGTRPYWKKFYRETEAHMRSAEILYTYAQNLAAGDPVMSVILRQEYQNLALARKRLALFAHHDGVTGTSRKNTMDDYGQKLMGATRSALQIQRQSIRAILYHGLNVTITSLGMDSQILNFGELATKVPRVIYEGGDITKKIIVFNSLSFVKPQLIRVLVTNPFVKVVGTRKESIISQINPVTELVYDEIVLYRQSFELTFLADLLPLTLHSFEIRKAELDDPFLAQSARVSCRGCKITSGGSGAGNFEYFEVDNITTPTIVLGNREQELYFNGTTGFLRRVTKLQEETSIPVKVQFGGYKSVFRDSGAYLLKPDLDTPIQIPFNESTPAKLLLVEGPVTSYLTSFNAPLTTTTRLLGVRNQGIHVENTVDLGLIAAEVFMRVDTWLNSTTVSVHGQRQPTMFTDQNGYTVEKRVKVPWIRYEGNVYPVNTMAYIQDTDNLVRFSILVDRAHGFNSMHPGRLETLIERRTLYDDGRGMSEGVTDNRKTTSNYIFHVERLDNSETSTVNPEDPSDYRNNLPTLATHHLSLGLIYAPQTFGYDDSLGGFLGVYSLLTKPLPEDTHLLTLRTMSNVSLPLEEEMPSDRALLLTLKLGYLSISGANGSNSCRSNGSSPHSSSGKDLFVPGTKFTGLDINSADVTDLAGVMGVQVTGRSSSLPIVERNPFEITSLLIKFRQRSVVSTATRFGGGGGSNYHSGQRNGRNQQHHQRHQQYARASTTIEDSSYEKA